MIIFPAIDLRGGKAVRLIQGDFTQETVYGEDPALLVEKFYRSGAQFLHVVDLDGALAGESRNLEVIRCLLRVAGDMKVEVGGGIRSRDAVASLLDLGVARVILGSLAVQDIRTTEAICREFGEQVVAGIDARGGQVAVEGWGISGGIDYRELGKRMAGIGIRHIIFTDISRDGKLQGVNAEASAELARASGVGVVVSGGVASLEDVRRVKALAAEGLEGLIIGKALYTGRIDLKEALAVAAGKERGMYADKTNHPLPGC